MARRVSPVYFPSPEEPSDYETIRFLEGPQPAVDEAATLDGFTEEFRRAFEVFGELSPCITFFGGIGIIESLVVPSDFSTIGYTSKLLRPHFHDAIFSGYGTLYRRIAVQPTPLW